MGPYCTGPPSRPDIWWLLKQVHTVCKWGSTHPTGMFLVCVMRSLLICANFYRPPTKLWEGNVFTGVCHSVHGGGGGGRYHMHHGICHMVDKSPLALWTYPPQAPPRHTPIGPHSPWTYPFPLGSPGHTHPLGPQPLLGTFGGDHWTGLDLFISGPIQPLHPPNNI